MSEILYEGIHDLSGKKQNQKNKPQMNYGTQKPLRKGKRLLNMEIQGFSSF